jgi:ribosomal 50S subunit-recycling heat shock protein
MKYWIMFILGLAFASGALAFNTAKPSVVPPKIQSAQPVPAKAPRETRVSFIGIVKEISESAILVERSAKGKVETMEFSLEKPSATIKAGDKVKISYVKQEGKNIVRKVSPVTIKMVIIKKDPAKETQAAPPEATLPQK